MHVSRYGLLAATLSVFLLAPHVFSKDEVAPTEAKGNGPPPAPVLPGFVRVPAGKLLPGCTYKDFKDRSRGDKAIESYIIYDVWGGLGPIEVASFLMGRYEVTNAQWKLYLDNRFRIEHVTTGQETLRDVSGRYIFRPNGEPDDSEWKAIYCFNWETIVGALRAAQAVEDQRQLQPDEKRQVFWKANWSEVDPQPGKESGVDKVALPAGLKLDLYRCHTPGHWYGWSRLSGLQVGKEYCDIRKAPAEAFAVPQTPMFQDLRLAAPDFAAYPIRYVSVAEALAFTEWAGCHLPSEYEWERAARGDRDNTVQFTGAEKWDRNAQLSILAWASNPACAKGPIPVDDPSVEKSDSPFGVRNMLGNVFELCRTFYDKHPEVTPEPPGDPHGLFNYALLAKGGAWGTGWQTLTISSRTGTVGDRGDLDIHQGNRVDSLGLRLVRHEQPGYDLLLHSILRLAFNPGRGAWAEPLPHAYAMPRMAGIDRIHVLEAKSPYMQFQQQALGVAFAPMWMTAEMTVGSKGDADRDWKSGKADGRSSMVLGVLRSDLPLRAGVRMTDAEVKDLREARENHRKAVEESKKKRKKGDPAVQIPPEPSAPDEIEKDTERNEKQAGLWREGVLPPGEWTVVYWFGYLGLRGKGGTIEGILPLDGKKAAERKNGVPPAAILVPDAKDKDALRLTFGVEEDADPKKPQMPPGSEDSQHWALCETLNPKWTGWPGRKPGKAYWDVEVLLRFEKGALANLIGANEKK